jgi:hypothetical protein
MMSFWRQCFALLGTAAISTAPLNVHAAPMAEVSGQGIAIVTGSFGALGRARKLDIVAALTALCGRDAPSCQVFCSETSFGRYSLGRKPICRVTYRCGDGSVRSIEAAREEPIMMRCPEREPEPKAEPDPPLPAGN